MTLDSIKIKNFKAVRDSGAVKLGPLTALVGNNGSGNSKKKLEKLLRNATCRALNPRRSYGH